MNTFLLVLERRVHIFLDINWQAKKAGGNTKCYVALGIFQIQLDYDLVQLSLKKGGEDDDDIMLSFVWDRESAQGQIHTLN